VRELKTQKLTTQKLKNSQLKNSQLKNSQLKNSRGRFPLKGNRPRFLEFWANKFGFSLGLH